MSSSRTYADRCAIARALDVIGARWALLVVRELLFGPLRYSEIARSLPGASTNMLSDRLRELTDSGVIERRDDSTTATYALTDWGHSLEPAVLALGAWGLRAPIGEDATLSPASVMLFLRGSAAFASTTRDRTLKIVLDGRTFTVTVESARLSVEAADTALSDVALTCSPMTLYRLLAGEDDLETALDEQRAAVHGDQPTLRLLLRSTRTAIAT